MNFVIKSILNTSFQKWKKKILLKIILQQYYDQQKRNARKVRHAGNVAKAGEDAWNQREGGNGGNQRIDAKSAQNAAHRKRTNQNVADLEGDG